MTVDGNHAAHLLEDNQINIPMEIAEESGERVTLPPILDFEAEIID